MKSIPWREIGMAGCLLFFLSGCKGWGRPPPLQAPAPVVEAAPAPAPAPAPVPQPPPAPAPNGVHKEEVFYNAQLAPQLPRHLANSVHPVLPHNQAVTLRFGIGPKKKGSHLHDKPNEKITKSLKDLPLTVVLHCEFCEPYAESMKTMTFRAKSKKSEDVVFQFTPQKKEGQASYEDKLQITIYNDKTGRPYDRLTIPVTIGLAEPTSTEKVSHEVELPAPGKSEKGGNWQSDVTLYVRAKANNKVSIEIQPHSKKMIALLKDLALDKANKRRVFNSSFQDKSLVQAMATSAYGAMSAVSLQGIPLKKFSATGADAIVSEESQRTLKLEPEELQGVVGVLGNVGRRLHRHMFGADADKDLRTLIARIEAAAAKQSKPSDQPLRLTIVTEDLSLPWQYLHPPGPNVDVKRFWGMRFSITVERASNHAPGNGDQNVSGKRRVIFAQYGKSADETIPHAEQQFTQLKSFFDSAPLASVDLRKVRSRDELLQELKSGRKEIDTIITFLHASAGNADDPPILQFNTGDTVTSYNLDDLLNELETGEKFNFLSRRPFIFLNACETGPARNLPHVKLEDALFKLGARGIIVTEVSVWISLGHEVATLLLARLNRGEPVSDALTSVRRQLYEDKANPLGLLYVYYGDPAMKLHR